jgi:hypothetical protein
MADKRRRKKRVKSAPQAIPTIDVPNPLYQPGHPAELERVTVVRALRDDPLGRLHARRQIDDAQFRAGREWQDTYESTCIGKIGSIDFMKEPVDGTPRRTEPITDRTQAAARKLARWDRILGLDGCAIIRDILITGMTMEQIARRRGDLARTAPEYFGRRFRECLTTLAMEMGYA